MGKVLLALWFALGAAHSLAAAPTPPPPPDGLFDNSKVLNPSQREAAMRAIATARAAGIDLYVALFTFLADQSIEQQAEELKEAWCPGPEGLVIVANTSTNQCTYLSHISDHSWISPAQLHQLFTESSSLATATEGTSSDKILAILENLAPRLSQAMASHRQLNQNLISPHVWWVFAGVTAATLALLALGSLARWIVQRSRQAATTIPSYFPTVTVSERFGAPFAGGVTAEISFNQPGKS